MQELEHRTNMFDIEDESSVLVIIGVRTCSTIVVRIIGMYLLTTDLPISRCGVKWLVMTNAFVYV